jgi:predicted RNA binding protein YcfA (HicA-like mRNA interferase family)
MPISAPKPNSQHILCNHTLDERPRKYRALEADGWQETRAKGSQHQFKHPMKPSVVTVPHPKKDLPLGTARAIYNPQESKRHEISHCHRTRTRHIQRPQHLAAQKNGETRSAFIAKIALEKVSGE